MMRVLFVCTGNTCRSPLAEGLLRIAARERGLRMEARSAGISPLEGLPVSKHTAAILEEAGESAAGKTSQRISAELVDWADLILTMTMGHKQWVIRDFPHAMDKTHTLLEYAHAGDERLRGLAAEREKLLAEGQIKLATGQAVTAQEQARLMELERQLPDPDIADPIGGSLDDYRLTAEQIGEAIAKWLDRLAAGSGDGKEADVKGADGLDADGNDMGGKDMDGNDGEQGGEGNG